VTPPLSADPFSGTELLARKTIAETECRTLAVRQVFTAAPDPRAHEMGRFGRPIAAACAQGIESVTIVNTYQNKLPAVPPDADEAPLNIASHGPRSRW
jgi:hypothetical protein